MIHLKKREEIPQEFTWDLSHLYPDQKAWEKDLQAMEDLTDRILANKGKITTDAHTLYETLRMTDELGIKLEWAGSYARMGFDVNMGNPLAKNDYEKIDNLYSRIGDQLAFYEPELLKMSPEIFQQYKNEVPNLNTYSFMFEKLFSQKEHVLSQEEEEILSRMNTLGSSFKKIYDDITVNDLDFPAVEGEKGEMIKANEVNYRKALTSYDRALRERFFKGLLGTYGTHINSLTSVIYGNVKYRTLLAKSRKYNSSRQMSLKGNHIPPEVYDSLIETVRSNVHVLQRYIEIRKKALGYDDIHF